MNNPLIQIESNPFLSDSIIRQYHAHVSTGTEEPFQHKIHVDAIMAEAHTDGPIDGEPAAKKICC